MSTLDEGDGIRWLHALLAQPHANPDSILQWVDGPLRRFFGFERVLLIHAQQSMGKIAMTHVLSLGHSEEYLQQLSPVFDLEGRGSLNWWLHNQQPFVIDPSSPPVHTSESELNEIHRYEFGRICAHGILDINFNSGTYFSFAGIQDHKTQWHCDALRLMTPVLNDLFLAYIRVQRLPLAVKNRDLTPRQREIVRNLINGLNNKAIAAALALAEQTVKNQLAQIYVLFGVSNRQELMHLLR